MTKRPARVALSISIVILLVLAVALAALPGVRNSEAAATPFGEGLNLGNINPPASTSKLIFIHHSCGENWLSDSNGGLGTGLINSNYFVSDTNYGWYPDSIGSRTDIGHWYDWFRGPSSSAYLAALYLESAQNSTYSRLLDDPGGENEIIMFKSCYPNSALHGDPGDPVPPIGSNDLRGQPYTSAHHTVANAKGIYIDLLEYFVTMQDKLFVVIAAPPLIDGTYADNARAFNDWLVNDWLDGYTYHNVFVFDFYNVLTSNGGDADTNDLGLATGNHHRWWNNEVQHKDDEGANMLAYPTGGGTNDHPSSAGNQKATDEFVSLLNFAYNRFQNPPPSVSGVSPGAGPVGTEVTVEGSFFGDARGSSYVSFGNENATSYTSWGDTEITCAVPSGVSGAVDVKVTNAGGMSNAGSFTVTWPDPTVTGITPSNGTSGGNVDINYLAGTGFRDGATVQLTGPSGAGDTGAGTVNATNVNVASSTKITCTFDLSGAAAGSYTVKVTNDDQKSGERTGAFTVNQADSTPIWYLAEGTTDWGFDCYVTIQNPNNEAVSATVTYMTDSGAFPGGDIDLPANSQATIDTNAVLGEKDFSTKVECKQGKTIAVDRTMIWTGEGALSPDGHCSIGVTSADTTWYLPEGSSDWGFECWLLIQNPNGNEATCQVTYMIEGADPVTVEKKVPAQSRKSYSMANDIGEADASIKVQADIPVIPERAMYRNNRREGHDSIGTTAAANDYYLAEGTTDWGFTTYVLVQNPNDTATDVTVTYMTSLGPVSQVPFTMPANSRKTICVNDVLPANDFSTQVTGTQPIIAERAMYWDNGTGEACHDSIGLSAPHTTFYLPDGQTSEGRETYTLVQNPNDTDVTVEISYLTPNGTGNVTFTETVGANSRKTFSMADKGIAGRAAVMVTCKTAGKRIMVERAMYWNSRGAGTDTIGGYSD